MLLWANSGHGAATSARTNKCRSLDELVRTMKINATPMVENIG
jgi:hypothetical protein